MFALQMLFFYWDFLYRYKVKKSHWSLKTENNEP